MLNSQMFNWYSNLKNRQNELLKKSIQEDPSLARNEHPKNWILNLITIVFVGVGIGILLYPLIINYVNYRQKAAAISTYDEEVAKLTPQQLRVMWRDAIQYNIDLGTPTLKDPFKYRVVAPPLDRYERTLSVGSDGMMAYVDIPKINLKLPIYHGTSNSVLVKGAGHIVTTQLPTTQASVHPVLTGHTGSIGHIFFDNITQLNEGDIFQVTVLNRHMSYQVDKITVIEPTDTSAIQPELGKNWITLLTCYPYGLNNKRYLVRAKYIGDNVSPTVSPGVPIWVLWMLLATILLTGIIVWISLARRREFTQELNSRQTKHKPNVDNKTVQNSAESQDDSSIKNPHLKLSFFRRRIVLRMIRHRTYTIEQLKLRRRQLLTVVWVMLFVGLICAWASFGLMMRTGFLPIFDFGYSWFDNHIFYFFDIISKVVK